MVILDEKSRSKTYTLWNGPIDDFRALICAPNMLNSFEV
jgi:hypothetical protein